MFNTKGKLNGIGQCWCLTDLNAFQLGPTGTSRKLPIDVMRIHVAQL